MMNRGIVAALVAALVAVLSPSPASAYSYLGKWDKMVVEVFAPVPDGWAVDEAIAAWNRGFAVRLVRVDAPCEGCITIFERREGIVPVPGDIWAGMAQPDTTDGIITSCLIHLRSGYRVPFHIAAHEIGHCLGLGHSRVDRSLMSSEWSWPLPMKNDYKKLRLLYYGAARR